MSHGNSHQWRRVAVCTLGLIAGINTIALAQMNLPPAPVVAAKVVKKEVASGQTYVGTVMPSKRSAVGSAVDGRVTDYPVNLGDRVKKGQPLCQLLTETIGLQIAAAEAELRLRAAELDELKNGSRPEEIAQAAARMESAQALREFAAGRLKRAVQLVKQGQTITQEQLEEFESTSTAAERAFHAAQQEHQLSVKGPRPERIEQARAKYEGQQELVRQLQDQLKKHTMIAPFDGYVVQESTEIGEWVTKGQVVATVFALDEIEIEAHVLDSQIDPIRVGMPVRVEVPALTKQPLFLGQVVHIAPQGDLKSRTFPVQVKVPNVIREDGPTLKAGMVARVTLPVGQPRESLVLPKDAIVFGGPAPMVYVVGPLPAPPGGQAIGKAEAPKGPPPEGVSPVRVELGVADGNWIEATGQIAAGDRVVVLGNERLRPGQAVRVTKVIDGPTETTEKPAESTKQ
jgi:RND family efflux transporter MFP subunit